MGKFIENRPVIALDFSGMTEVKTFLKTRLTKRSNCMSRLVWNCFMPQGLMLSNISSL